MDQRGEIGPVWGQKGRHFPRPFLFVIEMRVVECCPHLELVEARRVVVNHTASGAYRNARSRNSSIPRSNQFQRSGASLNFTEMLISKIWQPCRSAVPAQERVKKSKLQPLAELRSVIPAKAGIHLSRWNKLLYGSPPSRGRRYRLDFNRFAYPRRHPQGDGPARAKARSYQAFSDQPDATAGVMVNNH